MNGQLSMGATRRLNRHYQSQNKSDFIAEFEPNYIDVFGIVSYEFSIHFKLVSEIPKTIKFKSCKIEITGFSDDFYLWGAGFTIFGAIGGVSTVDCYSANTGAYSELTPVFEVNNSPIKKYNLTTVYIPIGSGLYEYNFPVFKANHNEKLDFDTTYKIVNNKGNFFTAYLRGYKYGGVNFDPHLLDGVRVKIILK